MGLQGKVAHAEGALLKPSPSATRLIVPEYSCFPVAVTIPQDVAPLPAFPALTVELLSPLLLVAPVVSCT